MNSDVTFVFQILGIEPTDDKRAIKRAYANLVKQYHPEEFPEKWKEIHDAYETALKIASTPTATVTKIENIPIALMTKAENTPIVPLTKKAQKDVIPIIKTRHTKNEREQDKKQVIAETQERDTLFDNIKQLSAEQKKLDEERQEQVMQNLIKIFQKMVRKRHYDIKEWENFFYQPDILPLISRDEFLYQLGNQFANREINDELYFLLKEQISIIKGYRVDRKMRASVSSEAVKYAECKIDEARREKQWFERLKGRIQRRSENIRIAVGVVLAMVLVILDGLLVEYHKEAEQQTTSIQNSDVNQYAIDSQDIEKVNQSSEALYVLQGDTEENMGKTSHYLKEVKLTYEDAACRVFIPDNRNVKIEQDCAIGEMDGIAVSAFFIETAEEKDAMMKSRIETICQQIEDDIQQYQNFSIGEALPMSNYLKAEYMTLYCEKINIQGDVIPMMYVEGYTVLKEKEGSAKEVIISMVISQDEPYEATESVSDSERDVKFYEILEELERTYGIDLQSIMQ